MLNLLTNMRSRKNNEYNNLMEAKKEVKHAETKMSQNEYYLTL